MLALGQRRNTLPSLTARLTQDGMNRLRSVEVLPAGASVLPVFDYGAKLADLSADAPAWPPRTEDLAQVSLALEVGRVSSLGLQDFRPPGRPVVDIFEIEVRVPLGVGQIVVRPQTGRLLHHLDVRAGAFETTATPGCCWGARGSLTWQIEATGRGAA